MNRLKFSAISDRRVLLLCFLGVLLWSYPVWMDMGMTGIGDWDIAQHRFEVIRRSVLEFHQWPQHNPWTGGGQPILGNPGFSLLSIYGLSTLLFGSFWGLRIGVLVYFLIGFIGVWKLSGIWWRERFIRIIFLLYVVANPALSYHLATGHLLFQTFWFLPWLLYLLARAQEDRWAGAKAALVYGLAFNESPSYVVQYETLIMIAAYVGLWVVQHRRQGRALVHWAVSFVPVTVAMTFYRIITIMETAADFSRVAHYQTHYQWLSVLKFYFFPYVKLIKIVKEPYCFGTDSLAAYLGITGLLLFLWSLRRGFRWWHGATFIFMWAAGGNDGGFFIMHWIQKIPTFSSQLCFSRVRMFIPFFFGIAAVWGWRDLWMICRNHRLKFVRYIVGGAGILMVIEVLIVSHLILHRSHVMMAPFVPSPMGQFKTVSSLPSPEGVSPDVQLCYRAIQMNLGWLHGHGAPYLPAESACVASDEPGYIGEFHQGDVPVKPVFWSPNRIRFEGLDPHQPLVINLNPGRPWFNNGRLLFPHDRIVEPLKSFKVMPDEEGRVDLSYRYPGQVLGIWGTVFWGAFSIIVLAFIRKSPVISGVRHG